MGRLVNTVAEETALRHSLGKLTVVPNRVAYKYNAFYDEDISW
jgi:hypothetical protein